MPLRNQIAVYWAFAAIAPAAVRHIDVRERAPVAHGYERLTGSVTFGINAKLAANRIIRDIQFAPENGAGEVEFTRCSESERHRAVRGIESRRARHAQPL
jgi:hypothetical protein